MQMLPNMYFIRARKLAVLIGEYLEESYNGDVFWREKKNLIDALALVINKCINNSDWMGTVGHNQIEVCLSPVKKGQQSHYPYTSKQNIISFNVIKKLLEKFGFNVEDFDFCQNYCVCARMDMDEERYPTSIEMFDKDKQNKRYKLVAKNLGMSEFSSQVELKLITNYSVNEEVGEYSKEESLYSLADKNDKNKKPLKVFIEKITQENVHKAETGFSV